jgi:site-specific DNA-methyltransferase (adenine-specific)
MAEQQAYCMDCMEAMRQMPDKSFELAIVDPPYRETNQPTKEMRNKIKGKMKDFGKPPDETFFKELARISVNQIVWGANNFLPLLPSTNCMLFWYKRNPMENYSDGEFAWTSFSSVSRCIPIDHFGAHTADKDKIHPTQKPVALYEWLLKNYAKPGDKILDTHLGSGSSRIAAYNLGFDFVGYEIDPDYFNAQEERFKKHTAQTRLIDFVEQKPEQINLLQV